MVNHQPGATADDMQQLSTTTPEPLGYVVLIREHGRWTENWDGELHPTAQAGNASLAGARNAGYTAVLTAATPVGPVPDYADGED